MKNIIFVTLISLFSAFSYAGFHCPDDVTINCDMDIHNTDMTGYPNTTGFNVGLPISYFDVDVTNGCGVGQVNRTWYQDLNNDGNVGADEPSCTQVITVDYIDGGIFDINWPPNRDLSCLADIAFEPPVIVHGPCDLVGYVYDDEVFELTNDACYKILRRFEVINWCEYDENNPNGGGRFSHTQVIKVTEKELPEFTSCEDITIAMDEGCQANVSISAAAADTGDCPSEELYWTVEIDLGWDLVIDYEYSYLLTGEFYIAPTANGEDIEITLPDLIDGGTHGAYYTVRDGCGNVRSCQQKIFVEDQKAPTPYCHAFVTAAFDADAMPAMVPAELFNIGATDNCTDTEDIKISFSADPNDTIKEIGCGSQGFQFFNIYAFDEAGNADFCEVFMLIFDNDGCSFRYAPMGTVKDVKGDAMEGVNIYLTDGADAMYETQSAGLGYFQFEHTELISDYYIMTDVAEEEVTEPTILDLVLLQKYMLGMHSFNANYQFVAADVNRDRVINPFDIVDLKNHLLGMHTLDNESFMTYIEAESIEESWRTYDTKIDYMDYDGSFDLLSVGIADMHNHEAELVIEINVEQKVLDNQTVINLSNSEKITVEGINASVQLPSGLDDSQIMVSSKSVDIRSNDYHYDVESGMLHIVSLSENTLEEDEIWMSIRINSTDIMSVKANVNWASGTTLVRSEVATDNIAIAEDDIISDENQLLSNIVTQSIILRDNAKFGAVSIYDLNGSLVYKGVNVHNSVDVSTMRAGMYIVTWSDGITLREAQFVKP